MAKKLDEATKLLIDSLPENLQKLATTALENGYMSQMDFTTAIEEDEVPAEEQDEVMEFFRQDLGVEVLETESFSREMEKYYADDEDENRDKTRNLLNADAEQVDVNDDDYEHSALDPIGSLEGNAASTACPAVPKTRYSFIIQPVTPNTSTCTQSPFFSRMWTGAPL